MIHQPFLQTEAILRSPEDFCIQIKHAKPVNEMPAPRDNAAGHKAAKEIKLNSIASNN